MATSPLGGFADLTSYRRLVDAQKARNADGLNNLIESYIGGAQQGNVLVNLPEIIQQQNQSRNTQALSEQVALALQQSALQREQSRIPLENALKTLKLRDAGVFSSPQIPGQPATLPAIPLNRAGTNMLNETVETEPNIEPSKRKFLQPEVTAPETNVPVQLGGGMVQDPNTVNQILSDSIASKRAQEQQASDVIQGREIAVANARPEKSVNQQVIGIDPATKRPLVFNPSTGETVLGELPPGVEYAAKPASSKSTIANLTPEEARAMVELEFLTQKPPSFGIGQSADRNLYLKTRGEMLLENGTSPSEVAANQARFIADKKALGELTAQEAKIMTFANTAELNLRRAEELSSKVDRTGVPVINRWLLAGQKKIAGDVDVAAFDAAVEVAINEAAKTLSSATGAGVTSDAARNEIRSILNSAQTPEQFSAVAQVLHTDLGNRGISYKQFKKNLMDSIGSGGGRENPTSQNNEAMKWLLDNPNDPRAAAIRKKLGI